MLYSHSCLSQALPQFPTHFQTAPLKDAITSWLFAAFLSFRIRLRATFYKCLNAPSLNPSGVSNNRRIDFLSVLKMLRPLQWEVDDASTDLDEAEATARGEDGKRRGGSDRGQSAVVGRSFQTFAFRVSSVTWIYVVPQPVWARCVPRVNPRLWRKESIVALIYFDAHPVLNRCRLTSAHCIYRSSSLRSLTHL